MVADAEKGFQRTERLAVESARKMVSEAKRAADEQARQVEILAAKQEAAGERQVSAAKRVEKAREEAAKVAADNGGKAAQKAADAVVKAKERELKAAQAGLSAAISARHEAESAAKSSADASAKAVELGATREKKAHEAAGRAARAAFAELATEKAKALGDVGGKLTTRITLPVLGGLGAFLQSARSYEDAMAKINVSGEASPEQMRRVGAGLLALEQRYAKLGVTATQAALAENELVRAGQSIGQSMKSVTAALNLATAGEMQTADAAQTITNVLGAFKLRAEESDRIADIIANVAIKSSASVQDVALSYSQVGASAKLANVDIRESAAMLKLLADAGVRGSDSGTALKSFLVSLIGPSDQAREALAKYKIVLQDTRGQMLPIGQILDQFREKLRGLNDMQRLDVLKTVFGTDGIRAAAVGLSSTAKEFRNLALGIDKAGEASRLANGSVGETTKTYNESKVAVQKFSREIGGTLAPVVRTVLPELTGHVKGVTEWFSKLDPEQQKAMIKWGLMAAAAGPVMKTASAIFEVGRGVGSLISTGVKFAKWVAATVFGYGEVATAAKAAALAEKSTGGGSAGPVPVGAGGLLPKLLGIPAGAAGAGAAIVAGANYGVYQMGQDFLGQAEGQRNARGNQFAAYQAQIAKNVAAMYAAEVKRQGGNSAKAYASTLDFIKGGGSGMPRDNALAALDKLLDSEGRRGMESGRKATVEIRRDRQKNAALAAASAGVLSRLGGAGDLNRELGAPVEADPKRTRGPRATDLPYLTGDVIKSLAKGIDTQAGSASCARFSSLLVAKFTKGVTDQGGKIEAGAKALVDRFLAVGAKVVRPGKGQSAKDVARAGDLVYYYGPKYGAMKDAKGKGYHVGVAVGDGTVRDSSGGKDARVRAIGAGATVLRLPKSRLTGFQQAGGGVESLARTLTPEEERAKAFSEGIGKMRESLAGLTDSRKKYADALGLSLSAYKALSAPLQATTIRLVAQAEAADKAAARTAAYNQSMHESAVELKKIKGSALDKYSVDMFDGALYKDLSRTNQLRVERRKGMDDEIKAQKDRFAEMAKVAATFTLGAGFQNPARVKASNEATTAEGKRKEVADDLLKSLERQYDKEIELNTVQMTAAKIKRENIRLTMSEIFAITARAAAIDKDVAMDKAKAAMAKREEEGVKASDRYKEAMRDLQAKLGSDVTANRRRELIGQFADVSKLGDPKNGGGTFGIMSGAVAALNVGLEQTHKYLAFSREVTEVEKLRDAFRSAADGIGDGFRTAFGQLVNADFPSFFSSLGSMVDGFVSRLGNAVIQSQIDNLIGGLLGSIGGKGAPGPIRVAAGDLPVPLSLGPRRAGGGHVEAGHLYRVNEEKVEGFRPSSSGEIVPLSTRPRGGGGGNTINITINVPGSVDRRTADQIAESVGRHVNGALARNG